MLGILAAAVFLLEAGPVVQAQGREVFYCETESKVLWLTAQGNDLVYHYGTPGHEELTIVGKPQTGNLHYRLRDENIEGQHFTAASIRFTNHGYDYIVNYDIHSRSPFPKTAHFLILRGNSTLKVSMCSSFRKDLQAYDFSQVPTEDPKFYSEMH